MIKRGGGGDYVPPKHTHKAMVASKTLLLLAYCTDTFALVA